MKELQEPIDGLSVSNFSSAAKIHVDSKAVTFTNVSSTEGSLNDRISGTAKEAVTLKEGAQKADLQFRLDTIQLIIAQYFRNKTLKVLDLLW